MRAAVYYANSDVRVQDLPEPRIGPGELLLRITASGICGSDVMEWYRQPKAPLVLGHEAVGTVVQVGQGAPFREGDRVFPSHHVPCMACHACVQDRHTVCDTLRRTSLDPGGFAELARVPAINVRTATLHIPPDLSDEEGTFLEPLGCVVRGQQRVGLRAGESVLVLGCGVAGLLHILLARAQGAGPVVAVDTLPARLEAAKRCGADAVVPAGDHVVAAMRKATGGRLADVVVAATGAVPALLGAMRAVEPGGRILWFAPTGPGIAVTLPFNELWRNEVAMVSTYGAAPADLQRSAALLGQGRVRVADLVTHRLPLARAGEAFRLVAEARDGLKVVLLPNA
ncbi:MAG: alcohol dehydrogenase catalytic domain-containing protein [Halobacteriales archaeon]|nr:alcohol dehydrogenase catalytic domain-containing protein [Halobacteriales archaeon]